MLHLKINGSTQCPEIGLTESSGLSQRKSYDPNAYKRLIRRDHFLKSNIWVLSYLMLHPNLIM